MQISSIAKAAALCGLLALSGCASKITQPDKYSGFLNNYSNLKEATSATGKPVLRWVEPGFDQSKCQGKDLNNENTPMAFENIKQVIDDMATDATMFDVNKK
ncbi:DUF3313 family protein [Escherichia albertii]|uniref:DUF3313 family protein n=1 Tax=Escherichia albertii TaxID=208962 RepID=UPI0002B9BC18|nr:DUF3313 family protein [Escherichia albertii]EFX6077539.1 DUF3313 family protein [Shigella boydii]MCZ8870900.1 DUF3313 family protein [Escherichia albertii]